jgi:hypothetical protein
MTAHDLALAIPVACLLGLLAGIAAGRRWGT